MKLAKQLTGPTVVAFVPKHPLVSVDQQYELVCFSQRLYTFSNIEICVTCLQLREVVLEHGNCERSRRWSEMLQTNVIARWSDLLKMYSNFKTCSNFSVRRK